MPLRKAVDRRARAGRDLTVSTGRASALVPDLPSQEILRASSPRATFASMPVELTQEVSRRLESDRYVWLTTVAKSGQPVPRLVWFFFDGTEVTVYSMPKAAKIAHITVRPQVSLNLDSDGNGRGIIVVAGAARVDAVGADSLADEHYQAKYHDYAVSIGMGDEYLAAFSTRLKITVDKVRSTPSTG